MNQSQNDMQFLRTALDAELAGLKVPDQVKRTLSQKMKKPYRQRRWNGWAWIAAALCVLLIYGAGGLSGKDRTDALTPAMQGDEQSALRDMQVQKMNAMVLSAKADERGAIWLQYEVNTVTDEKVWESQDGHAWMAYGMNETDDDTQARQKHIIWHSFNDYAEGGLVPPKAFKAQRNSVEVYCITGFEIKDAQGNHMGTWRHESHSLMQSGVIISSYVPTAEHAGDMLAGEREVQLVLDGVPMGSSLYTPLSGTVEAQGSRIGANVELEQ